VVLVDSNEAPVFYAGQTCNFAEVTRESYDSAASCALSASDPDKYTSNLLDFSLGQSASDFDLAAFQVILVCLNAVSSFDLFFFFPFP
jgi:hypothetical protein